MTKAERDRVREIIIEKVMKHRKDCDCMACRKGGWIDQAETAIREAIADSLEGMKKSVEKIPYTDCSQGSGSVGMEPEDTIVKVEQQYLEIKHEEYNQAIEDAQAKIREGGV